MFTHAIVRKPGHSIVNGITSADLGAPIYEKALEQHAMYIDALTRCGLEVTVLEMDERFPDAVFVEDTALLTKTGAIITNPGAASRQGEETEVKKVLTTFYQRIECIETPGTAEGGDVMMVGDHFYIGLSERTNEAGAAQMIRVLEQYDYTGSTLPLKHFLHLKTGLAYLERNNLLIAGEFIGNPIFEPFNKIIVAGAENYAANCIWVNEYVLVPAGFPKTKTTIEQTGYQTIEVDISEFRKLDGGLSCLSLRF